MFCLFPKALLSCVGEGREPRPEELAHVAEKIWREAYSIDGLSASCEQASMLARAALVGTESGSATTKDHGHSTGASDLP